MNQATEKNDIDILSGKYQRLIVETEGGEVVAEITKTDATPATGYRIRLMPEYD